jgi:hypothetical protein
MGNTVDEFMREFEQAVSARERETGERSHPNCE